MLKRLFLILALVIIPLTVNAETFVDPETKVQFEIPDGWRLLTSAERESIHVQETTIMLTPIEPPDTYAYMLFIAKERSTYFQNPFSGRSKSALEPLRKEIENSLKAEGAEIISSNIYTSPAGNGFLTLYTSNIFINMQYHIDSSRHTVQATYFVPFGSLNDNEKTRHTRAYFSLLASIKFP